MCSSWNRTGIRQRPLAAAVSRIVLCWLLLAGPPALAQNAAPPPAVAPAPSPAPAPPPKGFIEALGRWFDQGAAQFRNHLSGAKRKMDELGDDAAANSKGFSDQAAKVGRGAADVGKSAADATKNAVDATRNAVDAVAKLPTARMMSGRERCDTAPNGAPDCLAAAGALCRKHGYASGKSMDFTSAEECPARTLLGQSQECTTVTFISRAMCQ